MLTPRLAYVEIVNRVDYCLCPQQPAFEPVFLCPKETWTNQILCRQKPLRFWVIPWACRNSFAKILACITRPVTTRHCAQKTYVAQKIPGN